MCLEARCQLNNCAVASALRLTWWCLQDSVHPQRFSSCSLCPAPPVCGHTWTYVYTQSHTCTMSLSVFREVGRHFKHHYSFRWDPLSENKHVMVCRWEPSEKERRGETCLYVDTQCNMMVYKDSFSVNVFLASLFHIQVISSWPHTVIWGKMVFLSYFFYVQIYFNCRSAKLSQQYFYH